MKNEEEIQTVTPAEIEAVVKHKTETETKQNKK